MDISSEKLFIQISVVVVGENSLWKSITWYHPQSAPSSPKQKQTVELITFWLIHALGVIILFAVCSKSRIPRVIIWRVCTMCFWKRVRCGGWVIAARLAIRRMQPSARVVGWVACARTSCRITHCRVNRAGAVRSYTRIQRPDLCWNK